MVREKTVVRRISRDLDEFLTDFNRRNRIESKGVVESSKMVSKLLRGLKSEGKRTAKIVENIEF